MQKLRVFVSSTMKDLANERHAVVNELRDCNCEPVNAEGLLPTGASSWELLSEEIQTSHIFVLLLGDRYGWTPERGPQATDGKSVTHLEYDEARRHDIPILPFLKVLDYTPGKHTEEESRRDAFREVVQNYASGHFIAKFNLYDDLTQKVKSAIIRVLSRHLFAAQVQERAPHITQLLAQDPTREHRTKAATRVVLPAQLREALEKQRSVLFAGSGISLAAGMPSASALAGHLIEGLRHHEPGYHLGPSPHALRRIAEDFMAVLGRDKLHRRVREMLEPPQGVVATGAHRAAVKKFPRIVTTNYDTLFEQASALEGTAHVSLLDCPEHEPKRWIAHMHGSIQDATTLNITEQDDFGLKEQNAQFWSFLVRALSSSPLVAIGTSLNDPSVVRLLSEAPGPYERYLVLPRPQASDRFRAHRAQMQTIATDADGFFSALSS